MREILFRGKRLDNGEWVEGAFCPKNSDMPFSPMVDRSSIIKLDKPFDGWWFDVDPATVGQYTGLTDKNGKQIFEGDVVTGGSLYPIKGVVAFGEGTFDSGIYRYNGWYVTGEDGCRDHRALVDYKGEDGWLRFEVVGNIHDNPELLKGGEG